MLSALTEEDIIKFHNIVSQNVKRIRLEKRYSQLEVSLALGFKNSSFIVNAEREKSDKKFNLTHLYQLSVFFEVDLCEFFKEV